MSTLTPRQARITARERRRRVVAAAQLTAALAFIVGVFVVGANVAADILAEREQGAGLTLPACVTEDDPGPCFWDASIRGNGSGTSFIVVDGTVTYLPAGVR